MAEQTSGNRVKTTPDEPLIFLVVAAVGTVTPENSVTILPVAISPHTIGPIRIVVAKKPPLFAVTVHHDPGKRDPILPEEGDGTKNSWLPEREVT